MGRTTPSHILKLISFASGCDDWRLFEPLQSFCEVVPQLIYFYVEIISLGSINVIAFTKVYVFVIVSGKSQKYS